LSGQDAYQTGAAIAKAVNSGTVDSVVLTSGITFQDALSGSVLAKQKNAPILLVDRTVKSSGDAFDYIKSHLKKDGTLYILGGTGIIPTEFETALNQLGYNKIIRRGGWDQYATALLIAEEKQALIGTPVVIAYGENFPDALSFSSFAANKGWPILLTQKASLPDKVKEYLTAQNPTDVYIAGGTGVISDTAEQQVQGVVPSAKIHRILGWDQFDTSMAIAKEFAPSPNHIYVASVEAFAIGMNPNISKLNTKNKVIVDKNDLLKRFIFIISPPSYVI
jgi:putative cell wall-binding protein